MPPCSTTMRSVSALRSSALGEHEGEAVLGQLRHDVVSDPSSAVLVGGDRAEDLLDARIDGESRRIKPAVAGDQHPSGCSLDLLRPRQRVANRATLHRDDRVVSIAALRGGGQAGDGAGWEVTQQALDREGWDVVALVDDDVAVGREVDVFAAGERLDHRDVDAAGA